MYIYFYEIRERSVFINIIWTQFAEIFFSKFGRIFEKFEKKFSPVAGRSIYDAEIPGRINFPRETGGGADIKFVHQFFTVVSPKLRKFGNDLRTPATCDVS